jgi:transcriptional regulator with XRE-family HTH domain
MREVRRLSVAAAASLGRQVRDGRRRLRITQSVLARRVGLHQTQISRIELGRGWSVPLETWIAIGVVLDQPLAISLSRPIAHSRTPLDAGHLEIQEFLLRVARKTGRTASFELPTRPQDPSRSIDVGVRDARHRVLIIEEAWNTFGDLGAAIRATNRKAAEATDLAATIDDGRPFDVAIVWVVRATAANRALLGRYPEIVRAAFAGSSRRWLRALTTSAAPPQDPGLVWFDPSTARLLEWRLTAPTSARNRAPR